MSVFQQFQRQHLFLLIGQNTLPNYVSAKLLTCPQGHLYLIHSSQTLSQAQDLQHQLESEGYHIQLLSLQDGDSNAHLIRGLVRQILEKIPTTETLALNYTGGTKAMAVHAYIILGFSQRGTLFSYLTRDRVMIFDQANDDVIKVPIQPQDLSLSLPTLFGLHHSPLIEPPEKNAQLVSLTHHILQEHRSNRRQQTWKNWLYDNCIKYSRHHCFRSEIDLGNSPPAIAQQLNAIAQHTDAKIASQTLQRALGFADVQSMTDWFRGFWLEHYVLDCIQTLVPQLHIADYGRNFKVSVEGTYKDRGFEFDVAFTRCYQLYALSCTTSADRARCKSKLFEAAHRTKQMGGSEAKAALVCCDSSPKSLQAELSTVPNIGKVTVLSLRQPRSLVEQIQQWVEQDIHR